MGAAVTSLNMPKPAATPLANIPPVTVSTAVGTTGSIFSKMSKFFSAEWATDVGKACFDARKAGSATLTSFDWKGEYGKFYAKKAMADAVAPAAKQAVKKGLFSKLGSLLGKAMPFLQLGIVAYETYKGAQAGGTPEAIKAGGKSIASLAAFPVASALATAVLGITGFPALVAGALGAFGVNMLLNKFFPPVVAPQQDAASDNGSAPASNSGSGRNGRRTQAKNQNGFNDPMIRRLQDDFARRDRNSFLTDVDLSQYMG